jgi:tetratricopeptide (TPR) repeat protein
MPWRAPSGANDAIRQAVDRSGVILCDLEAEFHRTSPDGLIGWELMDDHVHPSLTGQAVTALAWAHALTNRFSLEFQRVGSREDYARRLGDNFYDRYAVAHQMRVLFSVPFLQRNNSAALARFTGMVEQMEAEVSPEIRGVMQEWQSPRPHAGMKRPLTGMVGRELMRQRRFAEALELFQYAQRSVPEYTSLYAEYVYFALVCGEKLHGRLDVAQRRQAAEVIAQCQVLMDHGRAESGFPQRHAGRLHQLRGEFAEAIPYLQAARARLGEQELVAADQALMVSYLKLGRFTEAAALAENGVKHSGQYAEMYRGFLRELEAMQATNAPAMPNSPVAP